MNGIDRFYDLISQEVEEPRIYERVLPLPIKTLARAAILAKFPDAININIVRMIKEEILDRKPVEDLIPSWYKEKWM